MSERNDALMTIHRLNLRRAMLKTYYRVFALVVVLLFGSLLYLDYRDISIFRRKATNHNRLTLQENLERTHQIDRMVGDATEKLLEEKKYQEVLTRVNELIAGHGAISLIRVFDDSRAMILSSSDKELYLERPYDLQTEYHLDQIDQVLAHTMQLGDHYLQIGYDLNYLIESSYRLYITPIKTNDREQNALLALNFKGENIRLRNLIIGRSKDIRNGITIPEGDGPLTLSDDEHFRKAALAGLGNLYSSRIFLDRESIPTTTASIPLITMKIVGPTTIPFATLAIILSCLFILGRVLSTRIADSNVRQYMPQFTAMTGSRGIIMRKVRQPLFTRLELENLPELDRLINEDVETMEEEERHIEEQNQQSEITKKFEN